MGGRGVYRIFRNEVEVMIWLMLKKLDLISK